jgi:hypothetical protein
MDEAIDTIRGHLRLNDADTAPYSLMAIGDPSRIVRPISPMLGAARVFAQPDLRPGGFHSWRTPGRFSDESTGELPTTPIGPDSSFPVWP